MSPARTFPHGVTSWIDVEVDDLPAAQDFYGGLFGWTFETVTPSGIPYAYVIARLEDQEGAGLTGPSEPSGAAGQAIWRTYVAVDDIDAPCAAVERAGGRIIDEPADAGQAGRWVNVL